MKKENSRRSFIKNISLATFSALALSGCNMEIFDEFLQKNFRTLSKEEKDKIIKNLEIKYKEKYGKEFHVSVKPAIDGTLFGYLTCPNVLMQKMCLCMCKRKQSVT
jgi:molybdopterin-containing oxidoreductase family iron-sulfur binding subunit